MPTLPNTLQAAMEQRPTLIGEYCTKQLTARERQQFEALVEAQIERLARVTLSRGVKVEEKDKTGKERGGKRKGPGGKRKEHVIIIPPEKTYIRDGRSYTVQSQDFADVVQDCLQATLRVRLKPNTYLSWPQLVAWLRNGIRWSVGNIHRDRPKEPLLADRDQSLAQLEGKAFEARRPFIGDGAIVETDAKRLESLESHAPADHRASRLARWLGPQDLHRPTIEWLSDHIPEMSAARDQELEHRRRAEQERGQGNDKEEGKQRRLADRILKQRIHAAAALLVWSDCTIALDGPQRACLDAVASFTKQTPLREADPEPTCPWASDDLAAMRVYAWLDHLIITAMPKARAAVPNFGLSAKGQPGRDCLQATVDIIVAAENDRAHTLAILDDFDQVFAGPSQPGNDRQLSLTP